VFETCPWGHERETGVFCCECHETLLHDPVMLPEDINDFSELVLRRGLSEGDSKSDWFEKIGKRIELFREVISQRLAVLLDER
jgi:hypothetical protein